MIRENESKCVSAVVVLTWRVDAIKPERHVCMKSLACKAAERVFVSRIREEEEEEPINRRHAFLLCRLDEEEKRVLFESVARQS